MQDSGASVSLLVSKAFPAKESESLVQMEDKFYYLIMDLMSKFS